MHVDVSLYVRTKCIQWNWPQTHGKGKNYVSWLMVYILKWQCSTGGLWLDNCIGSGRYCRFQQGLFHKRTTAH